VLGDVRASDALELLEAPIVLGASAMFCCSHCDHMAVLDINTALYILLFVVA